MSRTLQPEDQISHYRVVGPLGAGGMGEVYIAQDEKLERVVALKVLPPSLVRNEERVRRLVTEAKSASSLNHPNIVTIYEIGQDRVRGSQAGEEADQVSEPVHFISMELVSGETLSQKIHQEKTDLKTLLGYLAQAAEGIAKAHAAGIVHRDLKPGNIMVSKDGFVKVLDFGLAKLTEKHGASDEEMTSATTDVAATGAGVVLGTVGYMSPEQVQAKTVDHRSDIFSMGCMLYEAATRRRPFAADTNVETMHQILKEKPRPVEELNPEVPAEVRRIIRRCLAKSPDQRFQSMKDLAIEMREVVDEYDLLSVSAATSSSVASPGASGALGAPPRTRPGLVIAIAAAAILGIGGIGFGLYSLVGRGASAGGAGASLQNMKISVLMSRNDLAGAVLSADGRYLAFVTQAGRTSSLTVRQVRTGSDVVILPMQEVQIQGISFSPDGDYLYFRDRDPNLPNYSALFQVASLGGSPRKVFFDVDSAATFSPDGKRACFRRGLLDQGADSLVIAEIETGKERELIRIKDPDRFQAAPTWSPDGKRIVIGMQGLTEGAKAWPVAVDVETGQSARIGSKTWLNIDSVGWAPGGGAVLVSAFEIGAGTAHQIYRITYPGGDALRMTNDLDGYVNLSLSADGSSIAAVKRSSVDNLWVAPVATAREAEQITFASGSSGSIGQLVPLPHGAVAFTARKENKGYLWRMAANGKERRQLTSQGVFVINAAWDERAGIVFSQADAGEKATAHIWRMDADGSRLRQLTDGKGEQVMDLSPAGNAVLFMRWDEPRSIWVQKLDGGESYRIVEGEAVEQAFISPDGKRVLVAKLEGTEGQMFPRRYILPIEGGEPLASFRLPPGATDIRWTPDGKALTYVDRGEGWNIMSKSLPDGAPEPLTHFKDGQIADHRWHPDGSRMLLHRRVNQQHSLWMLKPGQAEPTLITEFKTGGTPRHEWAPDEPLLYFIVSASSQDVVMITDFR